GARPRRDEQSIEHGQVETFVFKGEGQMPRQIGGRRMPPGEDAPVILLRHPVAFARCREGARKGKLQAIGANQGGIAGGRRTRPQGSVVKDRCRAGETVSFAPLHGGSRAVPDWIWPSP